MSMRPIPPPPVPQPRNFPHPSEASEAADAKASDAGRLVLVWDAPLRLFHWLAAILVVAAYVTWRSGWMEWHEKAGEALLALLFFRLLWGFFGSETARFSSFLATPGNALRHLRHVLRREPDRQIGHNPAGGWMVLLLIALLFGETLTGVFVGNDVADEGPLTELTPAPITNAITALHALFWDALLAAVALHVLAILVYAA
ncbi:MAG TPA: cytochrome b/b6 domain-containing protein, partial [Stellaceae bacterium]|nr:cytochrome b/b6 domain-containing protein [Stellaceae bacterium]